VRIDEELMEIWPNEVYDNLIEFLLDSVYYLYMKSNPNPPFYPVLPYKSLSSHAFINKKIKEKKMRKKNNNQKLKEKKKKRNINIDLAVFAKS